MRYNCLDYTCKRTLFIVIFTSNLQQYPRITSSSNIRYLKGTNMKIKNARRRALAVLGACALALAPVVIAATPAQAAVYNCTTGYNGNGWAYAQCLTANNPSTDRYRVAVICRNVFWQSHTVYGDWQKITSGQPSTLQGCPAFETYYGTPWASNS